ncbi:hypothetical protein [Shewanella violacea]|uniref:Lipoprotein n=1 Tax=Shewanella violacea (strain JCM 10179 / CIP 106290 / LMG 19151 / DSS12) TaxID=637905 RepID=D4ZHB7_SHEVD|nr:hypothetical protein [Shewanella violacea]BAJ01066.1 hypothetical protein SVI_1095 [Shewanella violacea DSS12]
MSECLKISKIALLIASCTLMTACGGEDDGTSTQGENHYLYGEMPVCQDVDLNGKCGVLEQSVTNLESLTASGTGPFLIDSNGYFLTANSEAKLVSPFTTLIQNEVQFNPIVSGNSDLAKVYLQKIFGDKYNINFVDLDVIHGPEHETAQLIASFRHAISLSGDSDYLKIAAAVDKMVTNRTFDIRALLSQTDLDASFVNLNNQYLLSGSYPLSSLVSPKSITMNENTGLLLALTSDDKLLQINTGTGAYSSFPATSTLASPQRSALLKDSDHDDDDDDDDHDDDDDDDHCEYGICTDPGNTQVTSSLTFAAQGLSNKQAYLIYQPTPYGDNSISNTCNASGDNGIYLSEIGKSTKSTSPTGMKKQFVIDSYSGASGTGPIVIEKPVLPVSEAECFNNHINWLTPIYSKKRVVAVFTNGSGYTSELKLLDSETLVASSQVYNLNTATPGLVLSKQESELLVTQGSYGQSMILDSETLAPKHYIDNADIYDACFVNDDRELLISDGTTRVSWLDTRSSYQPIASLELDSRVKRLVSDPEGRYSSVLTANRVYLLDNAERKIIKSMPYDKANPYGMSMLTDKIIISRYGAIDYIQFANLVGSSIKVGYQMLSRDLVTLWLNNSQAGLHSTTLAHVLSTNGESQAISRQFEDIDIEWLPTNATTAAQVQQVKLTGYYRGERISLYKVLK